MSLVIKQTRVVEVPVQSISIAATCQQAMLIDAAGQCVGSTNAMPAFMPTLLEIDLATGMIKNWCVPTGEQLQAIADACADGQKSKPAECWVEKYWPTKDFVEVEPIKADEPPEAERPYTILDMMKKHSPDVAESVMRSSGVVPEVVPVILDSNVLTIDAPLTLDMLLDAAPAPVTAESVQREQFAEFLAERGIEPSAPKPTNQISVEYDHLAEKWTAETLSEVGHIATSTFGKFEAIKNVLKKAGLHGVYEINLIEDGLYGYDGSRTLNADTVYTTQGTDGASWSARKPNNRHVSAVIGIDGALTGLLKEMEGIQPEDAMIIETTDDEMRSRNKRRYAVTAKHEHAPKSDMGIPADLPSVMPTPATVEPVADPDDAVPVCTLKKSLDAADSANQIDIEDAPQPICQPARPRYRNPDDHGQTWTGRGKPPEWLQAKLDAGDQLTDYAISDNAA